MSKNKSIFVTALFAVMLTAIIISLYLLKSKVYMVFVGVLGLYGFLCAAFNFCQWLGKESCLLPPMRIRGKAAPEDQDDSWQPDPAWAETYSRIKAEFDNEAAEGGNGNV